MNEQFKKSNYPTKDGRYGDYGGYFIPELLIPPIMELKEAYQSYGKSQEFQEELKKIMTQYAGRPTPLTYAERLSKKYKCQIYLKREDLLHGGAHKLNNTIGQALLAKYMGKTKLIAETGAGQHGFATSIAGAYLGLEVKVFMGEEDIKRQAHNVHRMKLLGATIVPVSGGQKTLKDATNAALRYWIEHFEDTYYLIGSVIGPHPYPMIVRDFQSIIGGEIRAQLKEQNLQNPKAIIACIGGGSNAIGAFYEYLDDWDVELYGIEAAGEGADTNRHAIALGKGKRGILHGSLMYLMQDAEGNVIPTHSISAGLDYPGAGPEHCYLSDIKRIKLGHVTDQEALKAFKELCQLEGIIPALESSHALAYLEKLHMVTDLSEDDIVIVNLSGSGNKDLGIIKEQMEATQ